MADLSSDQPTKSGIKIEKPLDFQIHPVYPILTVLSILLVAATAWLLVSEYLGEPPPHWLKSLIENFTLTL